MASTLDRVRETQAGLLADNETYLAATRTRWKTGAFRFAGPFGWYLASFSRKKPAGQQLPMEGVWAVSSQRLFIWKSDRTTRKRPTRLVATFDLAKDVHGPTVAENAPGAGAGWTYLSVDICGTTVAVEAPEPSAQSVKSAIERAAGAA